MYITLSSTLVNILHYITTPFEFKSITLEKLKKCFIQLVLNFNIITLALIRLTQCLERWPAD